MSEPGNTRWVCKQCGSPRIHTLERILGTCEIIIHAPDDYDFTGETKIWWDSSTTTGYECRDCDANADDLADLVIPHIDKQGSSYEPRGD